MDVLQSPGVDDAAGTGRGEITAFLEITCVLAVFQIVAHGGSRRLESICFDLRNFEKYDSAPNSHGQPA